MANPETMARRSFFHLFYGVLFFLIAHLGNVWVDERDFLLHGMFLLAVVVLSARAAVLLLPQKTFAGLFILVLLVMYFSNPLVVCFGWIELEPDTSVPDFYWANFIQVVCLLLFCLGSILARQYRFTPRQDVIPSERKIALWANLLSVVGILGIITFFVAMRLSGVDVMRMEKSYRVAGGGQSYAYLVVAYISVLIPIAASLAGQLKWRQSIVAWFLILTYTWMHFTVFRVRSLIIAVGLAWICGRYMRLVFLPGISPAQRENDLRRLKRIMWAAMPAAMVAVGAIQYARIKYEMWVKGVSTDMDLGAYVVNQVFSKNDFGFAYFFRKALEIFPEQHPYLNGSSFISIITMPIPRSLWPGKPEEVTRIFASLLRPDGPPGLTIPPTIMGDLYVNFGYVGIPGMVVWGLIFGRFPGLQYRGLLYIATAGVWMQNLARGSTAAPVVLAVLCWFLVKFISRKLRDPIAP